MNTEDKIKNLIKEALSSLNIQTSDDIFLEHPADLMMGDYSSNIAFVLSKTLGKAPKIFAEDLAREMNRLSFSEISKIEVAGSGFINFYLSRLYFSNSLEKIISDLDFGKNNLLKDKKIMVEYTDPNPFKPFHIGHLMTNIIGESLARIFEFSGAKVFRANYQGDVGLHIAKAIWGILENETKLEELKKKAEELPESGNSSADLANWIGTCYSRGALVCEENEEKKKEIDEINKSIYERNNEKINQIYDWGFEITMDAFEDLYKILGTKFDYYFLESQMMEFGLQIVSENTGEIFTKSMNAVVFEADKYDPKLHTRVFITSQGLPTYETKELGLTVEKFKNVPDMDLSLVVTANEQMEYMKVVVKALSLIYPDYENKMKHITHGMMRLVGGKMSSRKGNVVTGESLLKETIFTISEKLKEREWTEEEKSKIAEIVGVSALKYSILKQAIIGDIVFDPEKSISFEGDSGPYLQYSCVRANSVIEKAKKENIFPNFDQKPLEPYLIERILYRFPKVVKKSMENYEPHHIANYLIELAREYNGFYGQNVIVDKTDQFSPYKIGITLAFSIILKNGLNLLGIKIPEKM